MDLIGPSEDSVTQKQNFGILKIRDRLITLSFRLCTKSRALKLLSTIAPNEVILFYLCQVSFPVLMGLKDQGTGKQVIFRRYNFFGPICGTCFDHLLLFIFQSILHMSYFFNYPPSSGIASCVRTAGRVS